MPLIIGVTAGGVLVPVQVDANGVVSVSAAVSSLPSLPAGTNNIGDVDVLTLPALPAGSNNIGDVDIVSLPALAAGTNNIGDVDVLTLPSLPAGNNNIGNVDVVTLPALPSGTNEIGKIQARNYGYVAGSFQKDPIRIGYSGDKSQQVSELTHASGTRPLTGDTVPSGEIWVVEAISAVNVNKAATRILVYVVVNGIPMHLAEITTTFAGEFCFWSGAITLSYQDKVGASFYSTDANDDLYLRYHGRRIDIDQ